MSNSHHCHTMCIPARFTSKENMRDPLLGVQPVEVSFINSRSLAVVDDMFYCLPFPDVMRMEKIHETAGVSADAIEYLRVMQAELDHPRALSDLETAWLSHLEKNSISVPGSAAWPQRNPARAMQQARLKRNKTPTPSPRLQVAVMVTRYVLFV